MPRLTTAVRNMVAARVAPSAEHTILARQEIDSGLLERVRRTVQTHLRSRYCTRPCCARSTGFRDPSFTACSKAAAPATSDRRQGLAFR